jgi:hypothetical protein
MVLQLGSQLSLLVNGLQGWMFPSISKMNFVSFALSIAFFPC